MNIQVFDFDATTVPPQQSNGGKHPAGMFDFVISNTYAKWTKNEDGLMLCVEFQSEVGKITKNYNLFNKSDMAVKIAAGEVSALSHVTGIFSVPFPKNQDGTPNLLMAGHTLRSGRGRMEVGPQKIEEPDGYMEVKRVFDKDDNEPGKGTAKPAAAQGNGWGPRAQAANAGAAPTTTPTPVASAPPEGWVAAPTTAAAPPWAQK